MLPSAATLVVHPACFKSTLPLHEQPHLVSSQHSHIVHTVVELAQSTLLDSLPPFSPLSATGEPGDFPIWTRSQHSVKVLGEYINLTALSVDAGEDSQLT